MIPVASSTNKTFARVVKRVENEMNRANEFTFKNMYVDEEKKEIHVNFYNTLAKEYCFVIDEHYPFRPPCGFSCNQIPYINIQKLPSQRFYDELKAINGKECFCCSSYMCKNNWSPAIGLIDLIAESELVIRIKKQIVKNILAKHIVDKYLFPDLRLNEYLN